MRYLKRYNESTEDLESKIRECFSGVSDMDINMKFDGYRLPGGKEYGYKEEVTTIEINLNNKTTGQDSISKWGVRYNPVINGQEIAFEISNAIQHCFGEDLNIKWAEVKWKNAGEWSEPGKTGMGPGFLAKAFSKTGTTKQFENPEKGHYNLEDLCDFIESKGDMLRQIEIHFVE